MKTKRFTDKQRLDWMSNPHRGFHDVRVNIVTQRWHLCLVNGYGYCEPSLRSAIDAAMRKEKE